MTECRANKVKTTGNSGGTIQPEALHPNLENHCFLVVTALRIQP
jgi:hypothetical protein